jgi:uncharacterized protein (TIGR00369 family)
MAHVQQFVGRQIPARLSPVGGWLGGTLLRLVEGEVAASYTVRPEMTNPSGILHGGIMATMLDELMGFTVFVLDDESFYASINLSIDFLASARIGEEVIGATRVIRRGRRVVNVEGTLSRPDGTLIARATSNLGLAPSLAPPEDPA